MVEFYYFLVDKVSFYYRKNKKSYSIKSPQNLQSRYKRPSLPVNKLDDNWLFFLSAGEKNRKLSSPHAYTFTPLFRGFSLSLPFQKKILFFYEICGVAPLRWLILSLYRIYLTYIPCITLNSNSSNLTLFKFMLFQVNTLVTFQHKSICLTLIFFT